MFFAKLFDWSLINVVTIITSVHAIHNRDPCQKIEVVKTEEWRARPSVKKWVMYLPVNHVIISDTEGDACLNKVSCIRLVGMIQDYHMDDQGRWDIAYNFLIGGDARVYEGRGWMHIGAFSLIFDTNSVGIGFIGNYSYMEPTKAMLKTARRLIKCGQQLGYLTPTVKAHGARDVTCTSSPGDNVYKYIRRWPNFFGGRMPNYFC